MPSPDRSHKGFYRVWHGLGDFCGDCALARKCDIRDTAQAAACPLVIEQQARDRREGKRRLLSRGEG